MIVRKRGYQGPAAALDQYESLVATLLDVDLKGATMPYTSRHGHMFSFLDSSGSIALRLSRGDREEFLKTYQTVLLEQHGRIMKEYVAVPVALLRNTADLLPWFERSHAYVSAMPPKPPARK